MDSSNKIWFGLDRGTNLTGLNGTNPFGLGVTQFHWDEHNRAFDWHTVNMNGYAQVAQDGSTNPVLPGLSLADETDTVGNLDDFKKHGGKLLTYVGGNDQLIMPRGVINYYRQMAARYGISSNVPGIPNVPNFANVQGFYRLFRAPGVAHCGLGNGSPDIFFAKLVEGSNKAMRRIRSSRHCQPSPLRARVHSAHIRRRRSGIKRAALPTLRRISTAAGTSKRRPRFVRTCW